MAARLQLQKSMAVAGVAGNFMLWWLPHFFLTLEGEGRERARKRERERESAQKLGFCKHKGVSSSKLLELHALLVWTLIEQALRFCFVCMSVSPVLASEVCLHQDSTRKAAAPKEQL